MLLDPWSIGYFYATFVCKVGCFAHLSIACVNPRRPRIQKPVHLKKTARRDHLGRRDQWLGALDLHFRKLLHAGLIGFDAAMGACALDDQLLIAASDDATVPPNWVLP